VSDQHDGGTGAREVRQVIASWNCAMGTAVARRTVPLGLPIRWRTALSASISAARACWRKALPASVSLKLRDARWISRAPRLLSSSATRLLMVVWGVLRCRDAAVKPPCSTARTNRKRPLRLSTAIVHNAWGSAAFDALNETLAFLDTSFFDAFGLLWYPFEHGAEGARRDALVAFGCEKVAKAHAHLKARFGDRQSLVGDRRSLADAYFLPASPVGRTFTAVDRRDYPSLQRLYERLQDDPAARFAHAIEEQEVVRSSGAFTGHVGLPEVLGLPREQA